MKKNNINILISIVFFILFLGVSCLYLFNKVDFIDNIVYESLIALKSDVITFIMKIITFFGSVKFIGLILIFFLFLSVIKNKKYFFVIYVILGEVLLNHVVKLIFQRARPDVITHLVNESFYSFPSGHTMTSVVLYGFLIYLINKSDIDYKIKGLLSILFGLIPILVMASRIYLGVHYFTDVIAGLFLALSNLFMIIYIFERKKLYEGISYRSK